MLPGAPDQWPRGLRTVMVVPAQKLSWHRTTLPRLTARRWEQALKGLLEEQLLEDPARLHLALAPETRPAEPTWVAACEKSWLEGVLQTMRSAGHRPDRIVPEIEPTSGAQATGYLYGTSGRVMLAQTGPEGVCVFQAPEPVQTFLRQWPLKPTAQAVWAEPELLETARAIWPQSTYALSQGERMQRAALSHWNLAQFGLNPSPSLWQIGQAGMPWTTEGRWPSWRPFGWGLVALVLTQALGLQVWIWRQSQLQQMGETEIKGLVHDTFPDLPPSPNPVVQMQQQVRTLALTSAAAARTDLVAMLSALALSQAPTLTQIEYAEGRLSLGPWKEAASGSTELVQKLMQRGYLLEQRAGQWYLSDRIP